MKNYFSTSVVCVLIGLAVLSVYGPTLSHDFVQWDDDNLVYNNPVSQAFSWENIQRAFFSYDPELYIPLTFLSYQFDHAVWGLNPFGFHLTNVLLHALSGILIFFILKKFDFNQMIALFGALIFAVHPINVEAVSWVSARKDLLMAFFVLLSFYWYLRGLRPKLIAFLFFILACFAKVTAVMLPLVLLFADNKNRKRTVPYILVSIIFLIIAFFGKTENLSQLSFSETILMSIKSVALTIFHVVVPFSLSPLYLERGPIGMTSMSFIFSTLAVAILCIVLWRFRRDRTMVPGALFFGVFLLPTFSNFARMGEVYITSDRYAYVPQMGLILLFGAVMRHLIYRGYSRWVYGCCIAIVLLFGSAAFSQSRIWAGTEALYRAALDGAPKSVSMRYNLATFLHSQERVAEAEQEYERVLALAPSYAKALNNFGVLHSQQKRFDEAVNLFERAIESDPSFVEAYDNLGRAFGERGMYEEGIKAFEKAMELREKFGYNKRKT